MIGIIAAMGREIEGDGEAHLSGGEIAAVKRVRIFGGGKAGILADRPRLVHIHGRIGAAHIGRKTGKRGGEGEARAIGRLVARFDRNAFGRQPWIRPGGAEGNGCGFEVGG